jgi:flavin reductase (DIM6/NTAB) family NADH-FMN oxidoreductase RutF
MEFLSNYSEVNPYKLNDNLFDLLDKQWMLITAGTENKYNSMTASWGGFGILWNKPIAIIFIRPHRFTYNFVEDNSTFNLSFFSEKYRPALQFMGSKSGRDFDKAKETGLTPIISPNNCIAYEEARLNIDCKKLYFGDLDPKNFIDSALIKRNYPTKDFHRFYFGEILGCYSK